MTFFVVSARIVKYGKGADVAELADALDSKSSVVTLRAGSSPAFGTRKFKALQVVAKPFLLGIKKTPR